MSKLSILPNLREIDSYFVFSVTSSFYEKARQYLQETESRYTVEEFLREQFSSKHYLMTAYNSDKYTNTRLKIYIGNCVYSCFASDRQDAFLLSGIQQEKPIDVTDSLRSGINLVSTRGTLFNITIKYPKRVMKHYLNGNPVEQRDIEDIAADTESIAELVKSCSEDLRNRRREILDQKRNRTEEKTEEKAKVSEEFQEYLSLAESYAQFEDESASAAAQGTAGISCSDPEAAEYDRIDRIAYKYRINGDFDDSIYKENTKVDLDFSEEKTESATIIGFTEKDNVKTVTLLFDNQVDYKELPKICVLRLSYSKVMFEVQQDVITNLRNGATQAKFLDRCVGQHTPDPVEMQDLSALEYSLNHPPKGQYPPTASQMEAIKRGISCNDLMLVQGPPGTGKTTVILEWVKYFCREKNYRVLISSQNNKAVDNVLERIADEPGIEAVRAGNEAKVQKNIYPLLMENKLVTFRQEIEDKINENLTQITEAADYVQKRMLPAYAQMSDKFDEYRKHTEEYQTVYKHILGDVPEAAENYAQEGTRLLSEMKEYEEKIAEASRKLESSHNFIMNFFTRFRMRKNIAAYDERKQEYLGLEEKYKEQLAALIRRMRYDRPEIMQKTVYTTRKELGALVRKAEAAECPKSRFLNPEAGVPLQRPISMEQVREKLNVVRKEAILLAEKQKILQEWRSSVSERNNYALSEAMMESVNVVGATCIGINSQKRFAEVDFDITIIDEAGQIQIHNALVPMSRSPKLIMLGDHKQIPPTVNDYVIRRCNEDDIDDRLERISLFEDMYEKLPESNKVLLDTQFRMPAEIADLLSEWFYEGKYLSFSGKRGMKPVLPDLFESNFVLIDTGKMKNHYERKNAGYTNRCEAMIVDKLVRHIVRNVSADGKAVPPSEIGVISPYSNQVKMLVSMLSRVPEIGQNATEVAATLDSFQGQERDIIIYSCTRSNTLPPQARGRVGFLTELRRLNVALSRAKKTLIFIGDLNFLATCRYGSGQGSPKEFSEFIRLMHKHVRKGNGQIIDGDELMKKLG